jgi:SagB-type dehydrogenase family enzyme
MQSLDDITMMVGEASSVARVETKYPAIIRAHDLSSDHFSKDKPTAGVIEHLGLNPGSWSDISRPEPNPEKWNLLDTIQNRRSMRNFSDDPLPKEKMDFLLQAVCSDSSIHSHPDAARSDSIAAGFLTSNVEGFDDGFHLLDKERAATSVIQKGDLIDAMTKICLGQDWLARSAIHFLFMTNLETLELNWGARGYRYAMMTAGSLGQRLYLSATSMKTGCCGIGAFFDDEASQLLGLNDKSRLLYLVAVGPVKKWPRE